MGMIMSIIPFFFILPHNELTAEGKMWVLNTNHARK